MKFFKTFFFWVLSCSWGILMTLYGGFAALGLLITGRRPKRYHCFLCFEIGEDWGGFEGGGFIFVNRGGSESLKAHEAGHGIQNLIFGPLMPFLVSIPSAIRYWVRRGREKRGKENLKEYDDIWFERMATNLGEKYFVLSSSKKPKLRFVK